MSVDWANFTPGASLLGGALIGLAAGILILGAGRIMGAAGIVAGSLNFHQGDVAWRLWLIAGLFLAPTVLSFASTIRPPAIETSWPVLIVAGLLVGCGTRLGSGCTSGHGICGVSRLSARSFAATAAFMASGIVTVFVARHLLVEYWP
jgi:uncharacterized membrane protein YedE/YeeE